MWRSCGERLRSSGSGGADDGTEYDGDRRRGAVVDAATIAVSVVSSGVLATGEAKIIDLVADRRRARLADEAADRAVDRYVRSTQAQAALERRRTQEATVDAVLGHGLELMRRAAPPGLLAMPEGDRLAWIGRPAAAQPHDLGRLADSSEGQAVISAYEECRAAFPTLAPVVDAFNKLNATVTQWRSATDTLPSH
jgi:hypothetical protein